MRKKWFILLITLIYSIGCTDREDRNRDNSNDHFYEQIKRNKNFLDNFSFNRIKINSKNKFPINELQTISEVDKEGNFYFVGFNNEIYKISKNGELLKNFSSIGRGPGEYIEITDIKTDEELNIYVLDPKQHLIIKYNKDFEYLLTIKLSNKQYEHPAAIETYTENRIICLTHVSTLEQIVIYDSRNGKVLKEYGFPSDKRMTEYGLTFSSARLLKVIDSEIYFMFPAVSNLYKVSKSGKRDILSYKMNSFLPLNKLASKTIDKYSIVAGMYQLTENLLLLHILNHSENEPFFRLRSKYAVVSLYGDVIKENIELPDDFIIYGQTELGQLILIKYVENLSDKNGSDNFTTSIIKAMFVSKY